MIIKQISNQLKRLKNKLLKQTFKPYQKTKEIEGINFNFYIGDEEGKLWYDTEATDPDWVEMRFIRDHIIKKGDIVLECGAHHGCTSVLFSKWVGEEGKIIAFEPNKRNVEIIEKNISINNIKNISVEHKAVGQTNGIINIDGSSNSSVTRSKSGYKVNQVILDKYADLRPDFVKIDVEGYEAEVLKGAKRIFDTCPRFAIEIHTEVLNNFGSNVSEILELLNLSRYKVWIQNDDNQYPTEFSASTAITSRVHLFGVPLKSI